MIDGTAECDSDRWLAALLTRIYQIPRDTVSLADFERRRHVDLPALSEEELFMEVHRVVLRLVLDDDPGAIAWLHERRQQVIAETRRREGEGARGRGDERTNIPPARHPASAPSLTLYQNGKVQQVG